MKPRSWSDAAFVEAVARHTNFTDVLRALGLRAAGGNHRSMKVHAERLGVDLRHFTQARRTRGIAAWREETRVTPERAFAAGSAVSRSALRCLCRTHLTPYACAGCGNAGAWQERPLTLQLDHANGDPDDHRLENLRWLCPNCHSQTGSFAGRGARRRPRAFGRELFSAPPTR
jgi:hypothetical protein